MAEYFTLVNIHAAVKFAGVLTTGLYIGGSMYLGLSTMPSMLAMADMNQALAQFQYFWPRERQLPICGFSSGLLGIVSYLIKRDPNDLPWLIGGVAMTLYGFFTLVVMYPNSIGPLMKADSKKDKDEKCIRGLLEKFTSYHHGRMLTGLSTFVAYTYCFGFR